MVHLEADLLQQLQALKEDTHRQVTGQQGGVGTFFQLTLVKLIRELEAEAGRQGSWENMVGRLSPDAYEALEEKLAQLQAVIRRRADGRFVRYADRIRNHNGGKNRSEIGYYEMLSSQGQFDCLKWKGLPLFKSAYDFAVLPMLLYELKPATVIELGSGVGGSALWLSDTLAAYGLDCHVYSLDLRKPAVPVRNATFLEGDCFRIEEFLKAGFLARLPHPFLVIEDAHANVFNVLRYLHGFMQPGDYFFVEDSSPKEEITANFMKFFGAHYCIDTHYTDLFGKNAVSAFDSVWVRT